MNIISFYINTTTKHKFVQKITQKWIDIRPESQK